MLSSPFEKCTKSVLALILLLYPKKMVEGCGYVGDIIDHKTIFFSIFTSWLDVLCTVNTGQTDSFTTVLDTEPRMRSNKLSLSWVPITIRS